jgi:hypothetical protein
MTIVLMSRSNRLVAGKSLNCSRRTSKYLSRTSGQGVTKKSKLNMIRMCRKKIRNKIASFAWLSH